MPKTTKLTLLALAIICFISIILNVIQCSGDKQPVDTETLTDSIAKLQKENKDTIKSLSDTIQARDAYISSAKERAAKLLAPEKVTEVFNK